VAKNLVIVESPAKAKTIEKYLGKDFRVEASMGHVRDLPTSKLGVDIEHDFQPDYVVPKAKAKVVTALKAAAKKAGHVFMATDLDREGEAIAWHLCEALGLKANEVQRVVFNEITKPAITAAFAKPGLINMNKVQAQEARRILDRLVGYKLSPLLWKKVAKGLSAGRVQSVAVRLVVEREREIRAFKTEEYWTVGAVLAKTGEAQEFKALLAEVNGEKFRPSNGGIARSIGDQLRRAAYKILALRKKSVQDKAPAPFITSQLQQSASTQLRYSTSRTMSIAQQLYQGVELGAEGAVALITYMRTDSYHVAPAALAAARDFISTTYGPEFLPAEPVFFKSKGRAQEAHEAIRPTDVTRTPDSVRQYLDNDAFRLYELIWKRFIASQMKPALWDVTEADIEAAADSTRGLFKARGRVLVYEGHTKLTGVRLGADEQQLPALAEGDALDLKTLEETQHFTQPPPRYSEASLVKKMESLGIGRPSTYAAIISTIQERGYVNQEERKFFATLLGETVTDKLVASFPDIMDAAFTSHMEDQLDGVEDASTQQLAVIREFWGPFSADLKKAGDEMESTKNTPVEGAGPCPTCGAPLVQRYSRHGPFLGCSKYPECKYIRGADTTGEPRPEPKITEHKCEKCGAFMMLRYNRRNEPFLGCEAYPKCKTTLPCDKDGNPQRPEPTGEVCDKCGSPMIIKNSRRGPFMACSAYPKCRNAKSLKKEGETEAAEGEAGTKAPRKPRVSRPKPVETDRDCPDCGAKLVIRSGRRGPFLGCSKYPKCKHAEDLPPELAGQAPA
jgi:DNA topoisomerase I